MKEHRFRGWFVRGFLLTLIGLMGVTGVARADTASVKVSSDPTEDKPVTVTISGQLDADRYLWVDAYPEATHRCGSANASEMTEGYAGEESLVNYEWVAAGSFQRTVSFTPPDAGPYRICAFVANGFWDTPTVKATRSFTVRAPRATSVIEVSQDPVAEKPVTLTVSGQTEIDRYLWVVAYPEAEQECDFYRPTDGISGGWAGENLMKFESIDAGNYLRTVTFTPRDPGEYRVCSFVADSSFRGVVARTNRTFQVRGARSEIRITLTGTFRHQAKSYFQLEGATEKSGQIMAYIYPDDRRCPARPGFGSSGDWGSAPVGVGAIAQEWRVFPRAPGINRICAYIREGRYGRAMANASATVAVKRNPLFRPKLITPNGTVGSRPPILKWKVGHGHDNFQLFASRPNRGTEPIGLQRRWVGVHGAKKMGRASKLWFKIPLAAGRYWWWIYREDTSSGYREYSRPRSFVVRQPGSRNRTPTREPRSLNRGFPLWTKSLRATIIPGIDSVSGHRRVHLNKEH